ncbi:MAG: DUF1007 family protein [Rhodospirillales bacterium]|nr:DUF1007 family protein [Rhodospirillales bacterium]
MRRLSLVVFLLLAGASSAGAHPHVWIEAVVTFAFKDGRIVAIRQEWTFDEVFGDSIIGQFDANKDKKFDARELAALEQGAFANLREFDYFSHLSVDDKAVPTKTVTGFAARVEKGRLVYSFTLPVEPGLDPLKGRVALGLYDPSYFVDVQTGGRAGVKYEGIGAMDCRTDLAENTRKPIFGGQVFPMEMFLTCRAP